MAEIHPWTFITGGRGSGRTDRLLWEASKAQSQGHDVLFIAINLQEAERIDRQLRSNPPMIIDMDRFECVSFRPLHGDPTLVTVKPNGTQVLIDNWDVIDEYGQGYALKQVINSYFLMAPIVTVEGH